MKLRTRLAATIGLTALVLLVLMGWAQRSWHSRVRIQAIAESTVDRMEGDGRARCEAAPERWPGRAFNGRRERGERRGPQGPGHGKVFAYDSTFQSQNPESPEFPEELKSQLEEGKQYGFIDKRRPGRHQSEVAVRMPWTEGPCAIVLVRTRPGPPWLTGPSLGPAFLTSVAAILVALFAVGPLVRRIRRLTEEVEAGSGSITTEGKDELGELARAFEANRSTIEAQVTSLKEREAALKSYIANTTHDVMLPITVLQGHLVGLQQRLEAGETLSPQAITPSLEEAHYVGSMLHNLNAAARLEAGAELQRADEVDMNRLVERVVARHKPIASRKDIGLEMGLPEKPVIFVGDLTLLEQALSNVVHNAVRYNKRGGHVAVTLTGTSEQWQLNVIDDGPGIPPTELTRVTERSFRGGQARTRHPHGMGLGLHIASDVAGRHGLSFELSETEGGGLTVTFSRDRDRD